MKCPNCGGNISLEDKYCPYCGAANTLAMQHVRDMEHYKGDYERTKREVYASQRSLSAIVVRVIALIIMIVAIITVFILLGNVYSLQKSYQERQSAKHAAEYMADMDQYLEAGDYLNFYSYCEGRGIRYADAYDVYSPTIRKANDYAYCVGYLQKMLMPGKYGNSERYGEYLTDSLADYYRDQMELYYGNHEADAKAIYEKAEAGMDRQIENCLVTYLGLPRETVQEFPEMTDARRAVTIEEALNGQTE